MKFPESGKHEPNFATGSTVAKVKHRAFREGYQKVPQKRFHTHSCLDSHSGNDDWNFLIFEPLKHISSWKNQKTFGNTGSKPFIQ